ncbi:hypothetical protein ACFPRL_16235 [Pseudoclavibacter helvolus]
MLFPHSTSYPQAWKARKTPHPSAMTRDAELRGDQERPFPF